MCLKGKRKQTNVAFRYTLTGYTVGTLAQSPAEGASPGSVPVEQSKQEIN